jgi:sporulation protein YlmC with PRC-barrel domain
MIRKLMASSAVIALISAGALTAAQAQDTAVPAEPAATSELVASQQVLTPDEPTFATAYIGKSVYSSEDPESDNIGDINDLILSEDGSITHAVVGVGGFLGIGEKNVAVPFDELKLVEQDGDIRFVYASTREQLEAAPALDRAAFDPAARAAEEQTASTDTGTDAMAPVPEEPASDMATAPAEEPVAPVEEETAAAPADEQTPAVTPAEPGEDVAAAPADEPAPVTGEEPAQDMAAAPAETAPATEEAPAQDLAAAPADEPAPVTGEEPAQDMAAVPAETAPATEEPAAEDLAAAPAKEPATSTEEEMASADTAAPTDDATTAETPAGEEQIAAETTAEPAPAVPSEGFIAFAADQIQASDLIGKAVYSGEESIGEISDLVLQKEGETRAALIDVGGFLGVGEKTVGIPFDKLQISKAEDGSEQVTVAMSKEELEQLPAVEMPAETAAVEQPIAPDATAPAAGEEPATTGSVAAPSANYEAITQEIAASKLMGATVYGPDESSVGEISDLVFNATGEIQGAVIDVGGFLGLGEKPVAVGFEELQVRQDENGSLSVMVSATKEQLDSAPAYEEPAETAVQ